VCRLACTLLSQWKEGWSWNWTGDVTDSINKSRIVRANADLSVLVDLKYKNLKLKRKRERWKQGGKGSLL